MRKIRKPSTVKIKKAKEVSERLLDVYGPIKWEPRYNAAEELVYTILSQHTSDINSERAFLNLMNVFEDLNDVADAQIEDIESAIRRGGLAKVKAPRIKNILNESIFSSEDFKTADIKPGYIWKTASKQEAAPYVKRDKESLELMDLQINQFWGEVQDITRNYFFVWLRNQVG